MALALRELRRSPESDDDVDPDAIPGWAVWRGAQIPVWNFLTHHWDPRIIELIDAFNELLPEKAPRAHYRKMEEIRYEALPTRLLAKRGITVCIADSDAFPSESSAANVTLVARDHVLQRAIIRLRSRTIPGEDPLCHEMMHVLTGIADIPEDLDLPYEDASCIWGYLGVPGEFDRRFISWVYRKDRGRRPRPAPGGGFPRQR